MGIYVPPLRTGAVPAGDDADCNDRTGAVPYVARVLRRRFNCAPPRTVDLMQERSDRVVDTDGSDFADDFPKVPNRRGTRHQHAGKTALAEAATLGINGVGSSPPWSSTCRCNTPMKEPAGT